jgi:hypothetical protein
MKDREIGHVDLTVRCPRWNVQTALVDRLRAEGVSELEVRLDDISREVSIRPVEPRQ